MSSRIARDLEAVFECSPVAAIVCDGGRMIVAANRAGRTLFSRAGLVGGNLLECFTIEDQQAVDTGIDDLMCGLHAVYRAVHQIRDAQRETWVDVSMAVHQSVADAGQVLVVQLHDITDRHRDGLRLRFLADRDALTGLLNRRGFEHDIQRHVTESTCGEHAGALLILDVDDFKSINDANGHLVGDQVLATVADALRGVLRESDIAGRIGGDEFAVLLPAADPREARAVASRIVLSVRERSVSRFGCEVAVSVSVGVSPITWTPAGVADILHAADCAMYDTKRAGGDGVTFAADHDR